MDDIAIQSEIERRLKTRGYARTNTGQYVARLNIGGRRLHIGTYKTPEEARLAYVEALEENKHVLVASNKASAYAKNAADTKHRAEIAIRKLRMNQVLMQKRIDTLEKEIKKLNKKLIFLYKQFNKLLDKP